MQWLKKEKTISKRRSPRALPIRAVAGMWSSLKRSYKNKSIHQLLGLVELLKNAKKTQAILTQDNAGTGSVLELQVHW
jgi:hypothetical protein